MTAKIDRMRANRLIYKPIKRESDEPPQPFQVRVDSRRERVAELFESGKNRTEIAKEIGVSHSTVVNDVHYMHMAGKLGGA